uniref:Uncharacterized protein n=1 Tax=Timema bartmani TaxID=61472 RepID=A0A7R9I3N8_9NEOP|nr:unnamed protein product [Timema bartmani]
MVRPADDGEIGVAPKWVWRLSVILLVVFLLPETSSTTQTTRDLQRKVRTDFIVAPSFGILFGLTIVKPTSVAQLANALVVLSSTAEDEKIEVRISVGGREGEMRGVASQPTKVSFRANKNRWIMENVDGASYRTSLVEKHAFGNINFLENE